MSDTRAALEDAIRAHVLAEGDGAYLTDWIVLAAAAMPDDPDATTYVTETSSGPIHHRLGMVRYLAVHSDAILLADDDA